MALLILYLVCILIWIYLLYVLSKTKNSAWFFLLGSMGLFAFLMIGLRPIITEPLSKSVAALAGILGKLTGFYSAYFKYGIIFVETTAGSVTLQIDLECSGVIEILAFVCLLAFFRVYSVPERILLGIVGFCYIMLSNALRIMVICLSVHWFGIGAYYVSHAFIGRIVFYFLSIVLYFYVFTKPQIFKMKVGNFSYGDNKETS